MMVSKSDFLLNKAKELMNGSTDYGVDLILCGGLSVHIFSDSLGRVSPRPWNHKDIDFVVPLSQFSKAIAFFKNLGYLRTFVSYKKSHLIRNHVRFGNEIEGVKVLVDVYGQREVVLVKMKHDHLDISVISPRIELGNWIDRKKRLGPKSTIDLSIEVLELVVAQNLSEQILT